ncbi:MAG: hypothetical protein EOR62_08080 [Mesorhizobium sp.]|nr:MAG: hypothetical protein EOR62_08080 [Mesorhizobium sp.]
MTKMLRNTLLAFVAVAAFAGSAMADQQGCGNTSTNKLWSGRCCGLGDGACLGGGHDHDRPIMAQSAKPWRTTTRAAGSSQPQRLSMEQSKGGVTWLLPPSAQSLPAAASGACRI